MLIIGEEQDQEEHFFAIDFKGGELQIGGLLQPKSPDSAIFRHKNRKSPILCSWRTNSLKNGDFEGQ